jgi:16S rRNA (adenine1518-N6/adenine1519-N6)-dimethyltransferase
MSEELADRCGRLSLFEIDRRFAGYLRELFAERRHTEVVEGDFLKTGKAAIEEAGLPDRVLGNLPYNAASQIIALLIEHGSAAGAEGEAKAEGAAERGRRGECRMVFTVQKEVGLRMMAKPGSREYSSFSVLCGLYAQVSDGGDVAAGSFYPAPKVVSRVVVVEPRLHFDPEVSRIAAAAARDAFAARRKTLRNALKSGALASRFGAALLMEALGEAGIDPDLRGETLSVERFASLARRIRAKEGKSQGSQP